MIRSSFPANKDDWKLVADILSEYEDSEHNQAGLCYWLSKELEKRFRPDLWGYTIMQHLRDSNEMISGMFPDGEEYVDRRPGKTPHRIVLAARCCNYIRMSYL